MPAACAGVLGENANAAATRKLVIRVRYSIVSKATQSPWAAQTLFVWRWRTASQMRQRDAAKNAGGGVRTHTILRSLAFESSASASSATPASRMKLQNGSLSSCANRYIWTCTE